MSAIKKWDWIVFGFGTLLIVIGLSVGPAWPSIYQEILESNLIITNHSKTYDMWKKTPLPMYLDIYLFNWKNAEEFIKNPKVKPHVEEVGPFIFQEVHERVNITWNPDGTISYNQTRNWTFLPELSVNLTTPITNLNVVALGAAHATRYSGKILQYILDGLLSVTSSLFVTKPAGQWLFEGMDLQLLDLLNKNWIKKHISLPIPFDKFGFFYDRNMSAAYDGRFKILTGSNKLTELGMLQEWNSVNKTEFFQGDCAVVSGSSGEIFPPTPSDLTDFTLFISDVCSSLTLKFARDVTLNGLKGREFVGDATMFDNGQDLPERACFCEGECQPAGVRNLTKCRQGAPVFVSFPHFYLADPSYTANIDGLSPNKSLHEFRITLDPLTGIPLDVNAHIQVNMLLQPYSMYKIYKNLPRVYVPMLWFNQRAHITPPLVSQALLLDTLHGIGYFVFYMLAVLGMIILSFRIVKKMKNKSLDDDLEPIIPDSPDSSDSDETGVTENR